MITKEQALEALDNLEDYSMMECGVNPIGPMKALTEYVEQMEAIVKAAIEVASSFNDTCLSMVTVARDVENLTNVLEEFKLKSDKDKLTELLTSFNVGWRDKPEGIKVGGWHECNNVGGYSGFYTLFEFDENGKFKTMGTWE